MLHLGSIEISFYLPMQWSGAVRQINLAQKEAYFLINFTCIKSVDDHLQDQ